MLVVINADAYPFLAFSDLTYTPPMRIQEWVFSDCTVPLDSMKIELNPFIHNVVKWANSFKNLAV